LEYMLLMNVMMIFQQLRIQTQEREPESNYYFLLLASLVSIDKR